MERKEVLQAIADNPLLTEALKGLLEEQFPLDNLTLQMDDAHIGQTVRARIVALQGIEAAFREIDLYKTRKEVPPPVARFR
jgi:hypothetical protein